MPSILSPNALSILEYKDTYNVLKLMQNKSQRQYMATRTCKCFVCKDTTVKYWRVGKSVFCNTIRGTVLSPWFVQLQRNKIQGLFKEKLQFSRSKIYSINWHSLTPFWTRYWLKHSMESFTIFTSSAMVDHLSHYVVILSATTLLCKMSTVTGYDLQSEIQKSHLKLKKQR